MMLRHKKVTMIVLCHGLGLRTDRDSCNPSIAFGLTWARRVGLLKANLQIHFNTNITTQALFPVEI